MGTLKNLLSRLRRFLILAQLRLLSGDSRFTLLKVARKALELCLKIPVGSCATA